MANKFASTQKRAGKITRIISNSPADCEILLKLYIWVQYRFAEMVEWLQFTSAKSQMMDRAKIGIFHFKAALTLPHPQKSASEIGS